VRLVISSVPRESHEVISTLAWPCWGDAVICSRRQSFSRYTTCYHITFGENSVIRTSADLATKISVMWPLLKAGFWTKEMREYNMFYEEGD
jgi:hypothetical protein